MKENLELIFIYDTLMIKAIQEKFNIPLEFVSLAYVDGYKLFRYRKGLVAMPCDQQKGVLRPYGNKRLFGAVFALRNPIQKMFLLDSYYFCSASRCLGQATIHDMRERTQVDVTLFTIQTLDDLIYHNYKTGQTVSTHLFTGNKMDKRMMKHIAYGRYRVSDGIDTCSYIELLKNYQRIKKEGT